LFLQKEKHVYQTGLIKQNQISITKRTKN